MQTLKQDICPGLSGKNILTYEIGIDNDQSFWLKLVESSGGGFVCSDWISIDALMEPLKKAEAPFTSFALHQQFIRKSANTPGFFMAVLMHEGLVLPDPNKRQAFTGDGIDAALVNFRKGLVTKSKAPKTARKKATPRKAKPK